MDIIVSQSCKNSFDQVIPWTYHLFPLAGIFLYLCYPKSLRIEPVILRYITVAHNAFLVLFSFWTFLSLSIFLYRTGFVFSTAHYFKNQDFDFIIYLFYLSKYYEFFDTFLLYLQGKTPIFLQKFHHIGAVIVWHLCYVYKVDAIWISSFVNSFVHTVMYSYYLGCILRINAVRTIKQYITSLQLVQLCIPSIVAVYKYYPPSETNFNYGIILFFVGYVAVLVYLFLEFYFKNYLNGKKEKPNRKIKDVENLENSENIKQD